MMLKKKVTTREIQTLDRKAIDRYGVPSLALMENAGSGVAREILRVLKRVRGRRVVILCGLGNNAGDGFVAARHLLNNGINPKIYLIGRPQQLKQDAQVNYRILRNIGYPVASAGRLTKKISQDIRGAGVIVDAIFGVGLNREVGAPFRGFIEEVNRSKGKVVAVDIPSGLDGTTGKIYGVCVKASVTVSFSFPKRGFYSAGGKKYCGRISVIDIGIPIRLMRKAFSS